MSHGLAPSKSTVYVSNLPYELKNNDLHKLFEKHGKIVKVTIVKDRQTRRSKGVAFVLFLHRDDAKKCVQKTNLKEVFGRTLKASIAKDNGRSTEFIRRKSYPDKSYCFECGETGHLSYKCEKNLLGEREPPPKKVRKRKKDPDHTQKKDQENYFQRFDEDDGKLDEEIDKNVEDYETLSAAIALEQEKHELENYRYQVATGNYNVDQQQPKKKIKKSSYFSDEEESD